MRQFISYLELLVKTLDMLQSKGIDFTTLVQNREKTQRQTVMISLQQVTKC